ncbi:hypothetical protein ANANG_G00181840 [Anguilla anguilla]|uniref:Uncharacterized protein n=1 Tax=Anguilla anguilla TaxID=7936 RepID=A0A9D3M8K0_ANGAN|nr:hypothetical protein ANANG_G00181840 [Anguilla anguilla]
MAFSVTKSEGTTIFTIPSDTESSCPLLCQILGNLCCSPTCLVSGRNRKVMVGTVSSLATVQIMVGLLTIGFGAILLILYNGPYFMNYNNAPYWLGAAFIISGIFTIFGERFPSPCLVFLTSVVNMTSAIFAVVAIVFYAVVFDRMCYERGDYNDYRNNGYYGTVNLTDLVRKANDPNLQLCRMYERTVLPVAMGVNVLLLVTAVLQLCVSISVAVLAIKAVEKKDEEKQVPEVQQPLMEEVTANHVA